ACIALAHLGALPFSGVVVEKHCPSSLRDTPFGTRPSMRLDNSPSNWRELYIAAILEIDQHQVLRRIHAAKMAICDRVEELDGGGKAAERVALNQAMKALSKLQAVYRCESQMGVGRAILPHDNLRRQWQVVALELSAETNAERVVELSKELIQALDQKVVG